MFRLSPLKLALGGTLAACLTTAALAPAGAAPATASVPETAVTIQLGDGAQPWVLDLNAAGTTAYVADVAQPKLYVVDVLARTLASTLTFDGVTALGDVSVSSTGNRAVAALRGANHAYLGYAVIDTATGTEIARHTDSQIRGEHVTVSADGTHYYAQTTQGQLAKIDTATGAELATTTLSGAATSYQATLSPDGSLLYLAAGNQLAVLNADDLTLVSQHGDPAIPSYGSLTFDQDPSVLYSTALGKGLHTVNAGDASEISSVAVGDLVSAAVGDEAHQRAWAASARTESVLVADFASGKPVDTERTLPGAPADMARSAATGELITANGMWGGTATGGAISPTVSILLRPSVSDPADVTIRETGDTATFSVNVTGMPAGAGLQWQVITAEGDWEDIPGATGSEYSIAVTGENQYHGYRVAWQDSFYGEHGFTKGAQALTDEPIITYEGPLPGGTVNAEYAPVEITATGLDAMEWSVTGVPEGMSFTPTPDRDGDHVHYGELSGTPTVAGDFTVEVTVTDDFGTDRRDFVVSIAADGSVVPPTTDPTAPPTTEPGTPGGPTPGNPGGGSLAHTGAAPAVAWSIAAVLVGLGALLMRRRRLLEG